MNPNAKEFVFNPTAREWAPSYPVKTVPVELPASSNVSPFPPPPGAAVENLQVEIERTSNKTTVVVDEPASNQGSNLSNTKIAFIIH